VCWGDRATDGLIGQKVKDTVYRCRYYKAMTDKERSTITEDGDSVNGPRRPARGRTARRWSDGITGSCTLPAAEAVHLATNRDKRRTIAGFKGPHGSQIQKKKEE